MTVADLSTRTALLARPRARRPRQPRRHDRRPGLQRGARHPPRRREAARRDGAASRTSSRSWSSTTARRTGRPRRPATTGVRVVQHRQNRGYGEALKTGIRHARFERIAIIDADGSYPPEEIPRLAALLDDAEMVVGARTGPNAAIPLIRRPAKKALTIAGELPDRRQDPGPQLRPAAVPAGARDRVLRPAAVEVLVHHDDHAGRPEQRLPGGVRRGRLLRPDRQVEDPPDPGHVQLLRC